MKTNSDMDQCSDSTRAGYELSDAHIAPVAWFTVGLFALITATMFGLRAYFSSLEDRAQVAAAKAQEAQLDVVLPPSPRLQITPLLDLQKHAARQSELMNQYAWVDRESKKIRIPIERAMQLLGERGMPSASAGKGEPAQGEDSDQ